jgi:hypothetical protein
MRTSRPDAGSTPAPRRVLRRMLVAIALVAVAMGIACFGALSDRAMVHSRQGFHDVAFGIPWPWIHQDLSGWGTPFPQQMAPDSPWENPTSLSLWAFLADVAVIVGALAALWLIGAAVRRWAMRSGRYRPVEHEPAWRGF